MLKQTLCAVAIAAITVPAMAANTVVEMNTSMGKIEIELFNDKAPVSAKNFENYVKSNFYAGTIFSSSHPRIYDSRWGDGCQYD